VNAPLPLALAPVDHLLWRGVISLLVLTAVFLLARHGRGLAGRLIARQHAWYDRVLNQQLLMGSDPRLAVIITWSGVLVAGLLGGLLSEDLVGVLVGAGLAAGTPFLVLRHLEQKRQEQLENQLVDGVTTLGSGVRAGLNLVQSMQLLVQNASNPIRQEFAQLLREYEMGRELNEAMQAAAGRIGLSNYRLLFTAVQMHRQRGGDMAESLDRIAESIREIQRLEGKLDALTAQGRAQARMMGIMPIVLIGVLYLIDPEGVALLFTEPLGRITLVFVAAMILIAFFWIRRIMEVDI